jgi:RND family efflux transporter MFP subunit
MTRKHFNAAILILSTFTGLSASAISLVSVEQAQTLLFYPQRSAPANVVALNRSLIPAELAARIVNINVNVGDVVVKGQLLAQLDCRNTQIQHSVEQARLNQLINQLSFEQREYTRGQKLEKQKNIGIAELDLRKTQLENAKSLVEAQESALSLVKLNVERCGLIAPFDGVVIRRLASVGEMIDFGKPVIELLEQHNVELSAQIANADKSSFEQAKNYQFDVFGQKYPVNYRHVVPLIENNARSQEVRFNFIDTFAIAGSTGRLIWQSPQAFLPAHLLLMRNGNKGFFIVKDKKATFVVVEGAQEGRAVPFVIANDSQIIIEGRHGLVDGEVIQVIDNNTVDGVE